MRKGGLFVIVCFYIGVTLCDLPGQVSDDKAIPCEDDIIEGDCKPGEKYVYKNSTTSEEYVLCNTCPILRPPCICKKVCLKDKKYLASYIIDCYTCTCADPSKNLFDCTFYFCGERSEVGRYERRK